MPRKKPYPLAHKKASVSIHRNGLTIDIADVAAEDVGLVGKELLEVVRTLIRAGYEELIVDGGSVHGGAFEVPDEVDGDDYVLPPSARRIGF